MKKIFLILFTSISFAQSSLPLLLDSGVSYQAETKEYQRLIDSVGGSITTPDIAAIDVFVQETASIRSKIVRFNPFGGANLTTALVPLFRGTTTGEVIGNAIDANLGTVTFQSADYVRTSGLGDTALTTGQKYLDTGVNPAGTTALGQDDAGVGAWITYLDRNALASNIIFLNKTNYFGLAYNTASPYYIFWYPPNAQTELNRTGYGTPFFTGLHYVSRTASNKTNLYYNADSVATSSAASIAEVDEEFWVFAKNGTTPAIKSLMISSGYVITKGLTKAEYAILYNAWNKLKTAFGR